jgi:hypothetical protein
MKEFKNIHEFCDFATSRNCKVSGPRGWAGYAVAYDYKNRAIARCFVYYC